MGHLYTFKGFLRSKYRMGIFLGLQNFKKMGMPDIPDAFLGKQ